MIHLNTYLQIPELFQNSNVSPTDSELLRVRAAHFKQLAGLLEICILLF